MKNQEFEFLKTYNSLHKSNYKGVLLFDMDDVLADLGTDWLNVYNEYYQDNLTPSHLTSWDTSNIVKAECGDNIYKLLKEEGLFSDLKPTEYSQDVMSNLIDNNFEVFLVSDSPKGYSYFDGVATKGNPADDKRAWAKKHFPFIKEKNIIFTSEKYLVQGNILVDDKPQTYHLFKKINRNILLMDRPYNRDIVSDSRVLNMKEVEKRIKEKYL